MALNMESGIHLFYRYKYIKPAMADSAQQKELMELILFLYLL